MAIEFISVYDTKPSSEGWYAVLSCFDPNEGFFPVGDFWDGEKFVSGLPVSNWVDVVFNTEQEAERFAHKHDPNW